MLRTLHLHEENIIYPQNVGLIDEFYAKDH